MISELSNIFIFLSTHWIAFKRDLKWPSRYLILMLSLSASFTVNEALFASATPAKIMEVLVSNTLKKFKSDEPGNVANRSL